MEKVINSQKLELNSSNFLRANLVHLTPKTLFKVSTVLYGERRWAADPKARAGGRKVPPPLKGGSPQGDTPRGVATAQKRYPLGEMR